MAMRVKASRLRWSAWGRAGRYFWVVWICAAHELFVATGYAATTIQAIADRAGVAVQTVYAVFGNKRELLRQLIERTITGDDEPLPFTQRAAAQSVATNPTPVDAPSWTPH